MNTKNRITQATLKLFATKGFEGTSIRDIALEARVNSSTLYHYIQNKGDFLVSIMKNGLEELIILASNIIKDFDTPEKRIVALVQMHINLHGTNQLAMLVIDNEYKILNIDNKIVVKKLRKEYELIWMNVVEDGVFQNKFKKVNDGKLTTFALLSMCTGIVHWYSFEGDISLEKICSKYAKMSLNLLGAENMDAKEINNNKINIPLINSKQ